MIIRIAIKSISRLGRVRVTSGVKVMKLEKGVKVAGIAKVRQGDSAGEEEEPELPEEK